MAIEQNRTTLEAGISVFRRNPREVIEGGAYPLAEMAEGETIKAGTLVHFFGEGANKGKFQVCKSALVVSGGSTSAIRVKKGHGFAVADVIGVAGNKRLSATISSINTTNADYDVINVSSALTGVTADDVLQEVVAYVAPVVASTAISTAEVLSTAKNAPNAIVERDFTFKAGAVPSLASSNIYGCVSLAIKANVIKSAVNKNQVVSSDWVLNGGLVLAENQNIVIY